jgi:hypothetical protein
METHSPIWVGFASRAKDPIFGRGFQAPRAAQTSDMDDLQSAKNHMIQPLVHLQGQAGAEGDTPVDMGNINCSNIFVGNLMATYSETDLTNTFTHV